MRKFLQVTLLFFSLILTAMQCDNGTLKIAQEMELKVNPNPIPVKNGKVSFDLITTLPAAKTLNKIDSLFFQLSYQIDGEIVIIGSSRMFSKKHLNGWTNLTDTTTFGLTDFSVPDHAPLYSQMNMFKNGRKKTSELLAISRFENIRTGF